MTANLQAQARALGDPTRYEVFRYIADASRPVDVAELTAHFGFNHNAIRQHLAKLVDAFESAALANPDTVCALHLGIAEGVAALAGDRVEIDELVPHDPRRANCRLRLSTEARER
jgi:DNA-binding transcriptional ArsR family regulator